MAEEKRKWIDKLEIENAQIKWAFSHFDGKADTFNDPGDHNFVVMFEEEQARQLLADGWNIKEKPPLEEGDPSEWHLQVKISYRFEAPLVYLIKNGRKYRADQSDLGDITRNTCEKLDVIIKPSPWINGNRTGITAYVEELYANIKTSRFSDMYDDYEQV